MLEAEGEAEAKEIGQFGITLVGCDVTIDLRLSSTHQTGTFSTTRPNPTLNLRQCPPVPLTIDFPPERRSLQRPGAKIECERNQRVKLTTIERNLDQTQSGPQGNPDVIPERPEAGVFVDAGL